MDHKHFQSAKRPFSVIFNSKPTNQVIRYEHEGQVSAKVMLEQMADFLKFVSNWSTLVVEQQCKNINEINRLTLVNWKISLSFVRKHLYSIKDIIAVTAYVIVDVLLTFTTISTTTVIYLMYFSGSEFHNKLLAMSGIFKTKNGFERKVNIGRNREQIFSWSKS